MNRSCNRSFSIRALWVAITLLAACGDGHPGTTPPADDAMSPPDAMSPSDAMSPPDAAPVPGLAYADPVGGVLRLVKEPGDPSSSIMLDLVVGSQPVTGYSAGFNLPLDTTRVTLAAFMPGTALAPGTEPVAAVGKIPGTGPLKGVLVTGQSQKASGPGAIADDTLLAPGTVLYRIQLSLAPDAQAGVVFDGTVADFELPSGGMRDKIGTAVVDPKDVAIGKLVYVK